MRMPNIYDSLNWLEAMMGRASAVLARKPYSEANSNTRAGVYARAQEDFDHIVQGGELVIPRWPARPWARTWTPTPSGRSWGYSEAIHGSPVAQSDKSARMEELSTGVVHVALHPTRPPETLPGVPRPPGPGRRPQRDLARHSQRRSYLAPATVAGRQVRRRPGLLAIAAGERIHRSGRGRHGVPHSPSPGHRPGSCGRHPLPATCGRGARRARHLWRDRPALFLPCRRRSAHALVAGSRRRSQPHQPGGEGCAA